MGMNDRRKQQELESGMPVDPNSMIYSGDQALRAQRGAGIDLLNQDKDVYIKGDESTISKTGQPIALGENDLANEKMKLMTAMLTSKFPKAGGAGEAYSNDEFLNYAKQNPDKGVDPRNFEKLMNLFKNGGQ